MQKKNKTAE
jgi:hypothetical protein